MERFFRNIGFITIWKFINCIISTAPISLWLALLSFKRNWKEFLSKPEIRLFCIFAVVDLTVKFYKMIVSGHFERRYMLPLLCILIIFAADGLLNRLSPLINKYLASNFSYLSLRTIRTGLIFILFIIYFIIIMIPSLDHPWFESIRNIVKEKSPANKKPVVLSNIPDVRIGYYANSELFVFSLNRFRLVNNACTYRKPWSNNTLIKDLPSGINNFFNNIKRLGGDNVFIFLYGISNANFKAEFSKRNLHFPFKLLKTFYDRHGRPVIFYQVNLDKKSLRSKNLPAGF